MLGDKQIQSILQNRRVYDLGQPLFPGMPVSSFHPPYIFSLIVHHKNQILPDGCGASNEIVVLSGHTGTHLDAIGHVAENGQLHGGLDAAQMQVGGRGLRQLGIEVVEPIVARGVLIARHGIHILEIVNLEELARDRVYTFLFIATPLKIRGATGSPVRPIAIV